MSSRDGRRSLSYVGCLNFLWLRLCLRVHSLPKLFALLCFVAFGASFVAIRFLFPVPEFSCTILRGMYRRSLIKNAQCWSFSLFLHRS